MHSSGSLIQSCLETMKFMAEEVTADAKYTNDYLVRQVLGPSMADVISRINHGADNPVLLHHTISVTDDLEYVILPPYIQEVWWLVQTDTEGAITFDWKPQGRRNPSGPGWVLDGNTLRFLPRANWNGTLYLGYTPNGNAQMHYSSASVQTVGSSSTIYLDTTPTVGMLDRLTNAYNGSILRLLGSGVAWEERVITSYSQASPSAPTVALRSAFERTIANGASIAYEICPPAFTALWEAVACRASLKLLASRSASGAKYEMVRSEYAASLKTIRDNLGSLQSRTGKGFERLTVDNPGYGLWNF